MKFKAYLLFFFLVVTSARAQDYLFNSLTVKDGLTQHDVSAVLQDSEGFIWIGTYDGLNRFNGYEIEKFYHNNNNSSSLSSNRIRCLFDDGKKRMWIGTDGYGLNYYSLLSDNFTRVKTPTNYELINDITKHDNGELIVATTQGLFKVSEEKNKISTTIIQSPLTGIDVKKIKVLENEKILFATSKGIWRSYNNTYELINGSTYESFNNIIKTDNNRIFVNSVNLLYEIKNDTLFKIADKLPSVILSMALIDEDKLWLTTFKSGIIEVDLNNFKTSKINDSNELNQYSLTNNALNHIYKDNTNTIWISNKRGVLYLNRQNQKFKTLPIIKKGHIRTLLATGKNLIYGYQADKFFMHSFKEKVNLPIQLKKEAKPFRVDTLDGNVYLATTKGLYKQVSPESTNFKQVPIFNDEKVDNELFLTSFVKDKLNNKYFGTFNGLLQKTNNKISWIHNISDNLKALRNVRVFTLKFDYNNNCLWVGTISKGLFKLNFDEKGNIISLERFNEEMSGSYFIPNNSIWSFYEDKNKTLYVGTDTGLLYKRQDEEAFSAVNSEYVQNKKIMGVVEDNSSNLWLTNSLGIVRYSIKDQTTKRFNFYDGLLTNTFTEGISKNKKGEIFFASILGVNYLKSDGIFENNTNSEIAFTKFLVNKNKVNVNEKILGSTILQKRLNNTDKINLNYKQNDFSIEFANTNYSNTFNNKYRYKLEKYNKNWQLVSGNKRFASYANIPSGTYKFSVQTTKPNGEWSKNIKNLTIRISPKPWLSWWAYLLYFLIFSSITYILFDFWNNKQKLKNQIKLSKLKNEQEKEINEMKLVFFTDVAHEFKTPLSLIIGPLKDLLKGDLSKEQRDFNHNILSRSTNRMMNLVNQLLDFRKVNSGVNILKVSRNDLCEFIREISKAFEWQAKNRNINFKVIGPDSYICHFDKDILEKIIYNLLSNAFKYSPNNGIIEIEIKPTWKQDLEYFVILIKDNGKGISQIDKKNIFKRYYHGKHRSSSGIGLHLTATLIDAHKGEINVLNSSLGGTEFMITLPVSAKIYSEDEFLTKDDIPIKQQQEYLISEINEIIIEENNSTKERMLIVEDDYDLRKYLVNILKNDYLIYEAADGKEGLQKTLEIIPDIIISDVMMPEMDGIEMCKRIKKNILVSHIPLLMLTAKTGDEYFSKGLKVGAWDYISKPFNANQLFQKVKNISETRNQFREIILEGKSKEIETHYVSHDQKFVKNATSIVEQKMSDCNFSVVELAGELGLSRMQLHRKLKSLIGKSTTAFINSIKVEKAKMMFDNGCDRVQEAMDATGVSSYAHFNTIFKKQTGVKPSSYIENKKELS